MIQYRLIKEYSGSPKLGTIDWFKTDEFGPSSNNVWQGTNFYNSHPEFWQKVEELDYEILSLIYKNNGDIVTLRPNGKYVISTAKDCLFPVYSLKEQLEDNGCDIHSVKRLSDGEVFTVGDLIYFGDFGNKGFQPIDKIEIDYFDKTRITAWNSAYGLGLEKWKKAPAKTPLFTTEDSVEIFNGDIYWSVTDDFKLLVTHSARMLDYKIRAFSTKEKAEEYILLNKPCLSLNDLLSTWGNAEFPENSPLFNRFKKLAQSKL